MSFSPLPTYGTNALPPPYGTSHVVVSDDLPPGYEAEHKYVLPHCAQSKSSFWKVAGITALVAASVLAIAGALIASKPLLIASAVLFAGVLGTALINKIYQACVSSEPPPPTYGNFWS